MMMTMRRHIVASVSLAITTLLITNAKAQTYFVNSTTLSSYSADTTEPLAYQCAFISEWTENTQPIDYPVGKKFDAAHWGPPLVVSHNENYELWSPGGNASAGFGDYTRVRTVG